MNLFSPLPNSMTRSVLLLMLFAGGGVAGCRSGGFANANDALRARVVELERQVGQLERRKDELAAELAGASAAPDSLPGEIRANTPRVTTLGIGTRSHVRPVREPRGEGGVRARRLLVYIEPADGRGRFVQMVGSLTVHVDVLPGDAEPVTIGHLDLAPAELRDAYRSGMLGTHYTAEVPLDLSEAAGISRCDVRVVYTDGRTGRRLDAHASIDLE